MITKGTELYGFINSLNAEADLDIDVATTLVENGKAILEEEREWMVLRKIDTSKTASPSNTWQTAIDLSTITDFSRMNVNQDGIAVKLFDGNDQIEYYRLKPFDQRLEWKNVSYTCVYDENAKMLYLNGNVPFLGTLYIPYVSVSPDIDLTSESAVWTNFPKRFLPLLAYYAIGIFKGGIDYDTINKQMLPTNQAVLESLKDAMNNWDNSKQLAVMQSNDPSEYPGGYPRAGAIDRYEEN
jgi:hypothetical protein